MNSKHQKKTGLLPLFLNQANGGCRGCSPGVDRLFDCGLSTGFREEVEADYVLIALKGLDIGDGVVSASLCSAPPSARQIDLSYFKSWQIGALCLLENRPLREIDLRRPLDRLDRGKALQQILGRNVESRSAKAPRAG